MCDLISGGKRCLLPNTPYVREDRDAYAKRELGAFAGGEVNIIGICTTLLS